jgi:(p)ppGpp synthase/HD superfamily hydrolase
MPPHRHQLAEPESEKCPPRSLIRPLLGERLTHILREPGQGAPGQVLLTSMLDEVLSAVRAILPSAAVSGRVKALASALDKAQRMNAQARPVLDALGIRVLVEDLAQCYQVIDTLHRRYRHVEAEYDDYIANPKANGYRSLHTTVFGPDDHFVEIQVRTRAMHVCAEHGTAAHRLYKCRREPEWGADGRMIGRGVRGI